MVWGERVEGKTKERPVLTPARPRVDFERFWGKRRRGCPSRGVPSHSHRGDFGEIGEWPRLCGGESPKHRKRVRASHIFCDFRSDGRVLILQGSELFPNFPKFPVSYT